MNHRKLAFHYFIRAGLLTFFAYYILHLVKQDHLNLYIAPRNDVYVKAAVIGFYFLAVLQLYAAFRSWWGRAKNECGCTDCNPVSTSRAANGVFYSLFAIPLLLGLLLPDVAMNSNLAAKKGVSLTGNVNQKATALTASNKTDSVSVSLYRDTRFSDTCSICHCFN